MTSSYFVASLYIGELKEDVSEPTLYQIFSKIGSVANVRVCRDSMTQRSLGYGYVNFHNTEDAERALNSLNYQPISGHPCRIMWACKDPALRRSGIGNLFINKLAKTVDSKTLYDTFSAWGNILSCKVMSDKKTGESRGYGFVHFEKQEDAEKAMTEGDNQVLGGQNISVVPFRPRQKKDLAEIDRTFTNIFIKNLDPEITDEELLSKLEKYGQIVKCSIAKEQDGRSRGFAFCNFGDHESAKKAVDDLNGTLLGAKELYVSRHQRRWERQQILKQQYERLMHCNLFVKHLDDTFDEEKLRKTFEPYGSIVSTKLQRDPTTKQSKGFGFVCFNSPEEAGKAIQALHNQVIGQKKLYVQHHQRKEERRQLLEQLVQSNMRGMRMPQMATPLQYNPYYYPMQQQRMFYQQQQPQQQQQGRFQGRMGQQYPYQRAGQRQHAQMGHHQMGMQMQQYPMTMQGPKGGKYLSAARNIDQQKQPETAIQHQQPQVTSIRQKIMNMPPQQQKESIGEYVYHHIEPQYGELAGKITGMLLEMESTELLSMVDAQEELDAKAKEAFEVLQQSQMEGETQ